MIMVRSSFFDLGQTRFFMRCAVYMYARSIEKQPKSTQEVVLMCGFCTRQVCARCAALGADSCATPACRLYPIQQRFDLQRPLRLQVVVYTKPSRGRGCIEVLDGCARAKRDSTSQSPLVRREEEEGAKVPRGKEKDITTLKR